MPIITFRQRGDELYCYIAKQDLEAKVLHVEYDTLERWGGLVSLEGGKRYTVTIMPGRPEFPLSLRASRDALV